MLTLAEFGQVCIMLLDAKHENGIGYADFHMLMNTADAMFQKGLGA